jgi:hypothetical protein
MMDNTEKDYWPVLLSKIVCSKSCIYLSRWQKLVNRLDDVDLLGDSNVNPPTRAMFSTHGFYNLLPPAILLVPPILRAILK